MRVPEICILLGPPKSNILLRPWGAHELPHLKKIWSNLLRSSRIRNRCFEISLPEQLRSESEIISISLKALLEKSLIKLKKAFAFEISSGALRFYILLGPPKSNILLWPHRA